MFACPRCRSLVNSIATLSRITQLSPLKIYPLWKIMDYSPFSQFLFRSSSVSIRNPGYRPAYSYVPERVWKRLSAGCASQFAGIIFQTDSGSEYLVRSFPMDSDKSAILPQAFLDRMKEMLQDDHKAFLEAYDQPRTYGLRVNTAKISCEEFERIVPFEVKKIPWISNGYFYSEDIRPSLSPLPGRALLSSGAQCHDTCFPDSHPAWGICAGYVCRTWGKSNCRWFRTEGERASGGKWYQHYQGKGPSSESGAFWDFQSFCGKWKAWEDGEKFPGVFP